MKSKFSYKSKRTIIIAAIITVLLAGTATGVYFFTKGNAQAQAAGDNNTTQEQYGDAPEENKNEQQNNTTENEQNKNEQGETTPNQQEEQETERQEQTTNNNQTTQNEQTTTTTTGEVPNQEYVTEREETVKNPWESLEVGWGPTQFASIASTANLTAKKSNLEIHKTVDKESVKIGDTLTYTISVKNNGDKVAKAIIYDNVPEGTVLLNKDNNEDENTKKLTWRVTVEPGETEKVEFTVRVKAEKGTIKNSAIINGKTTNETETGIINITGKKEVDKAEAKVGDTLTYTITLTNNGNADGTVTVTDEIPTGTRIKDENTTGYNKATNTMTWSNVEVKANGGTATLTLEVVVKDDTTDTVKNVAKIDNKEIPEKPETKVANITGVKSVDKSNAKVGDTLIYTITLTNNGNADGTVTVTDEIPTGTRIKDENTTGYNKEINTMTWSNVEVKANGETATLTLEVVVKDNTTDTVKNVAKIDNKEIPEKPETKVANITGAKSVDKPTAKVGDTLTYTIKLTNSGNGDGKVTVTDEIPTGTRIKDENTTGYNKETNTMTWSNVEVKAGKSAKLALEVVVEDNISIIKNIAYVDGNKIPEEPETTVKHHYTVEHYTENLDGTYSKVDKDTVVSEDVEIGTKVSYEVKKYEGFEYDESQTVNKDATVPDNNNLVVKLYYTRNSYKVTYEYEGTVPAGASNLPEEATYKYGANVTVAEEATAPGYTFSGWDKEDFTMPAEDVVIKGSFTANTDTQYKVEHYLQDLDGNSYTLKDTETLAGTTDTTATATPKQYPGFTYDSTVEGTKTEGVITGDGQLVLKLYYTRNNYKVTYEYEVTPPSGASALPTEETYKYGASVTVAEDATAPGYKFSGWDHEDFTMPAEDVVIKGSFEARNDTKYRVEHYLENLNDEGFTLEEGKDYAATTDTKVTAEPKEYPGFTFDSTVVGTKTEGIVTGDGQLVLKLYYVRATYTYTIHYFYNGVEDEGKQEGPFQGKFGEKIDAYTEKNEEGKYTKYDVTSSNKTAEAILTIGTGVNFINVYYGTPQISINKAVSTSTANVGEGLHYTITVEETRGLVDATGVNVTDKIPEGLENITTNNGTINGENVEWNNLTIAKGSSVTLEFDATVKANMIGKTISNTATLGGSESGNSNTVITNVNEIQALTHELTPGQTGKDAANIVLVMDLSSSMNEKIKKFTTCTHEREKRQHWDPWNGEWTEEYCPEGCKEQDDGTWGKWEDTSTTRLAAAKEAAQNFVNNVYAKTNASDPDSKATITVITFNQENGNSKYVGTKVLTFGTDNKNTATASNYNELVTEIGNINIGTQTSGLGTHIRAALDKAYDTIYGTENEVGIATTYPNNSNYVIFLGDGDPTTSYNNNNKDSIDTSAQEIKDAGATIYSIGFGEDISDKNSTGYKILESISSEKKVYTANDSVTLTEIFKNLAGGMNDKTSATEDGKIIVTPERTLYFNTADGKKEYITVQYNGTTLMECKSQEELNTNEYLTYSEGKLSFDVNKWNSVESNTKIITGGENLVLKYYIERAN